MTLVGEFVELHKKIDNMFRRNSMIQLPKRMKYKVCAEADGYLFTERYDAIDNRPLGHRVIITTDNIARVLI